MYNTHIWKELWDIDSAHFQKIKYNLLKCEIIMATYQRFILDNKSLELDFNSMNLFRDQDFYKDYKNWRGKLNNFINQAYFTSQNDQIIDSPKPFKDDIDLWISYPNNTKIQNTQTEYGVHYEPLLLAQKIYQDERDQGVDNPLLTYDGYFYILTINLKIT